MAAAPPRYVPPEPPLSGATTSCSALRADGLGDRHGAAAGGRRELAGRIADQRLQPSLVPPMAGLDTAARDREPVRLAHDGFRGLIGEQHRSGAIEQQDADRQAVEGLDAGAIPGLGAAQPIAHLQGALDMRQQHPRTPAPPGR